MKLFVQTFGCRSNRYDTEAVLELAQRGGYEIVSDAASADVAVINTCAVTAEAERDARRAVRRLARANPRARTVVMGCASALPASERVLRALPTVTHTVAGADLAAVARALEVPANAVAGVATRRQGTVRAVLRVQDGCDEHCTFCATTLARGANRSRPADEVVREASVLAQHHPEIVITGTHIGSYGADCGTSLGALLQRLVREVPVVRFRLSSLEATEMDDALADLMVTRPDRLAPHLHAPLQSGSDRILKRMGRHWYTARSYAAAVERLAARMSVFGLGADVIVGFPGETDADFTATVALIDALPFTYLHVFAWSARPGTAALRLADAVPAPVVAERSARVRDLCALKARGHERRRNGTWSDVVVMAGGGRREAVTEDYLTVALRDQPRARGERCRAMLQLEGEQLVAIVPMAA